jgi:hypothetical protein
LGSERSELSTSLKKVEIWWVNGLYTVQSPQIRM